MRKFFRFLFRSKKTPVSSTKETIVAEDYFSGVPSASPFVPSASHFGPAPNPPFAPSTSPFVPSASPFGPAPNPPFVPSASPFVPSASHFGPAPNPPFVPSTSPFAPSTSPFAPSTSPFAPSAYPASTSPFAPSTSPFAPSAYPAPNPPFVSSPFVPSASPVPTPTFIPSAPKRRSNRRSKPELGHQRTPIPPEVRQMVWQTFHRGSEFGPCYACGTRLHRFNHRQVVDRMGLQMWHCSHVVADVRGGEISIANLRTCCQHCNLSMGNQNLYAYIRDKGLTGPGAAHAKSYLHRHTSQVNSRRTNNFGRRT